MSTLKARIEEAMERTPGVTQADIARACKVKTPSVADWLNGKTKSLKPEPARLAAALFGCDQNWIGQGVGAPNWRGTGAQSPKGGPSLGGAQSGVTIAQQLSQPRPTIDPPTIEWGDHLPEHLPPRFILALPDDALAPDFPAGTRMSWSTEKAPRVGSVVLVRDRHGQAHAREYTQGRAPGQWIAAPTGRAFASLEGAEVTLLAVAEFEYRLLP